jgi:hypothetical protein
MEIRAGAHHAAGGWGFYIECTLSEFESRVGLANSAVRKKASCLCGYGLKLPSLKMQVRFCAPI